MEADEEKRKIYKEAIKDIPFTNLVYIDESGIEMSMCKKRRTIEILYSMAHMSDQISTNTNKLVI